MAKAMPRNPPKHIFSQAVAAWVRQKNLQLLAANAARRERRKAQCGS